MTAIYVLPCWLVDLDNDMAEIYRTPDKAAEVCARCFNIEKSCPNNVKPRCARRMNMLPSGLDAENSHEAQTSKVTG